MNLNSRNFDLHSHTFASDGILSATALVALAHANGCEALAITDHDTTAGIAEGMLAAQACGLRFIPGVEISVSWAPAGDPDLPTQTIHIVGLNVNIACAALQDGLAAVRGGRLARGRAIADALVAAGIPDLFDAALGLAENKTMLGRTHFARAMVQAGVVKDVGQAFKRYLTPGNPGYVPHRWASLADAVGWIRAANGVAVIAHPGRYRMHRSTFQLLCEEFRACGGQAMEVVTGSHSSDIFASFATSCKEFGFFASRGSDFHSEAETPILPGCLPTLADIDSHLKPVWELFPACPDIAP